jgi:hypothetical protein
VPFDPAIKQAAKGSDFAEAAMHQSGLASRAADRVEVPEMPDRLPKERHPTAEPAQGLAHVATWRPTGGDCRNGRHVQGERLFLFGEL